MSWVHPDPTRLRKLLGDYRKECTRQKRMGCPALIGAGGIVWSGLYQATHPAPSLHPLWVMGIVAMLLGVSLGASALGAMLWPSRSRRRVLRELMREDEVDLIPALIDIRTGQMPQRDRAEVDERLAQFLKRVSPRDARRIDDEGQAGIRALLRESPRWMRAKEPLLHQTELTEALLHAVVQLGDTSALRPVAVLAEMPERGCHHERIRGIASQAAASLKAIVDRSGDRLLRPADAGADTLLRPAEAAGTETLLRAVESGEAEERQESGQ